jgi:hypothetical protein
MTASFSGKEVVLVLGRVISRYGHFSDFRNGLFDALPISHGSGEDYGPN